MYFFDFSWECGDGLMFIRFEVKIKIFRVWDFYMIFGGMEWCRGGVWKEVVKGFFIILFFV